MHEMIGALLQYRHKLQHQYQDPHFTINVPTMNLGVIQGGDNPNRICGHCELEFDVRMLPGMTSETVRDDIRAMLVPIAERHGTPFTFEPLFPGAEPFANDHSDLIAACEKLTGHSAESVAFGTEAPFMQELGMDTVVLGPGSIDVAHQPNEYMAMDQVAPCINILQGLISRYCLS
jgi:acetylornithine deacetylase